ncbi:hypothetical protein [Plebeiibacterium marinum]|uniref:Lipocalin-like domain-containing protein n=1 Tax=Plebeiibacterium marinum TaxID=2992111 RepID=A0AAE3MFI8_9BACT|nr:hypothetical protein [Plebeiobacterium marinum]MCW3806476.1 hypothetical protein [Plebeiobacterium marinum]
MKKIAFFLAVIVCAAVVLPSCGKDDTKPEDTKSALTFNGTEFNPNSMCELWHDNTEDYFKISLWDGSLYLNTSFEVKGEGDWLTLILHKNSDIPVGTYTFGEDEEEEGFFYGYMKLGVYQSAEGYTSNESSVYFTAGTLKVEATSDQYTYKITLDLTGDTGESYKGTVTVDFRYMMQVY